MKNADLFGVEQLRRDEWFVADCSPAQAQGLVSEHHYARGGSLTGVYFHGLYHAFYNDVPVGVAWWLPPTRVACESVNKEHWKRVLSLSRMVVQPGIPKNACSFLLSRSTRLIERDGRFVSLVTYADESQGHDGSVYRTANWEYVGRTGPYPRWLDAEGRQVAVLATKSRTKDQMLALGHQMVGRFYKHKFVKHLRAPRAAAALANRDLFV